MAKRKDPYGAIFLGAIFLLVAAYLFMYVESASARMFGGGVLTILGVITLVKAFRPNLLKK